MMEKILDCRRFSWISIVNAILLLCLGLALLTQEQRKSWSKFFEWKQREERLESGMRVDCRQIAYSKARRLFNFVRKTLQISSQTKKHKQKDVGASWEVSCIKTLLFVFTSQYQLSRVSVIYDDDAMSRCCWTWHLGKEMILRFVE